MMAERVGAPAPPAPSENVDLDFWLGATIEGFAGLFQHHPYSADLITDPYPVEFVYALEGSCIRYRQQQIVIHDILKAG